MLSFDVLQLRSIQLPPREEWPPGTYPRTIFGMQTLWHEYNPKDHDDDNSEKDENHSPSRMGRHLPVHHLQAYRQVGDPEIDDILEWLAQEGRPLGARDDFVQVMYEAVQRTQPTETRSLLSSSSSSSSRADAALRRFHDKYSGDGDGLALPSWVDKEQLQRGQIVYLTYLPAIGSCLYYQSLIPGFSIPEIAAVLYATRYLAPPSPPYKVLERLVDTGVFSAALAHRPGSFLPHQEGWKAALQVRALHAKVRRRLRQKSSQWDVHKYGIPINQQDMQVTLYAFGCHSMFGCEFFLGKPLPLNEQLDYIAFWRYIGWLLGCHTVEEAKDGTQAQPRPLDICGPGWIPQQQDPIEHAKAMFASVMLHLLRPDQTSVRIAHHLLRIQRRPPEPDKASTHNNHLPKEQSSSKKLQLKETEAARAERIFYFQAFHCRRFIGDPLADALELPYHPSWWRRQVIGMYSTAILVGIRIYTWCTVHIPMFRHWALTKHQNIMTRLYAKRMEAIQKGDPTQAGFSLPHGNQPSLSWPSSLSSTCPFAMTHPPDHVKLQ